MGLPPANYQGGFHDFLEVKRRESQKRPIRNYFRSFGVPQTRTYPTIAGSTTGPLPGFFSDGALAPRWQISESPGAANPCAFDFSRISLAQTQPIKLLDKMLMCSNLKSPLIDSLAKRIGPASLPRWADFLFQPFVSCVTFALLMRYCLRYADALQMHRKGTNEAGLRLIAQLLHRLSRAPCPTATDPFTHDLGRNFKLRTGFIAARWSHVLPLP